MKHTYSSFLPENMLQISASTYADIGKVYGASVKNGSLQGISPNSTDSSGEYSITYAQAIEMLQFAENLKDTDVCTVQGRNVLQEYLELLYGYCLGVGISRTDGLIRQAEISTGCQTMIIKNTVHSTVGFLHTEENFDDTYLREIYKYIDVHPNWAPSNILPQSIESSYQYKLVDAQIHNFSYTFFGYPDLCFGGPAMGCNHTSQTFMCVDSLYTKTRFTTQALWANAIVTMFFLLGDIKHIRTLVHNLIQSGTYILSGYAFHIVNTITREITSFEFGGDQCVEITPDRQGHIEYIGQPNYPRSIQLQHLDYLYEIKKGKKATDIWYVQTLLEMEERQHTMKNICLDPDLSLDADFHKIIHARMHAPPSALERDCNDISLESTIGFISPYLAGYATGFITPNTADIVFGKLFPPSTITTHPKFWYSKEESKRMQVRHLFEESAAYLT